MVCGINKQINAFRTFSRFKSEFVAVLTRADRRFDRYTKIILGEQKDILI